MLNFFLLFKNKHNILKKFVAGEQITQNQFDIITYILCHKSFDRKINASKRSWSIFSSRILQSMSRQDFYKFNYEYVLSNYKNVYTLMSYKFKLIYSENVVDILLKRAGDSVYFDKNYIMYKLLTECPVTYLNKFYDKLLQGDDYTLYYLALRKDIPNSVRSRMVQNTKNIEIIHLNKVRMLTHPGKGII